MNRVYKLKPFFQKKLYSKFTKETNFYVLLKDKKDDCFQNLPRKIDEKTDQIYHHFFESLEKVRDEELNSGNKNRVQELDEKALQVLTTLRENGISTLKIQGYYKYFVNK